MNNIFTKITENAKKVSLTQAEKNVLMDTVSSYMAEHPLPTETTIASPYANSVIDPISGRHNTYNNRRSMLLSLLTLRQKKFMPIIIALMLMLGGGTSLAAQNALPGDALYGVKVHVNENIKSAFAIGADARAKVEADIARERLVEAEKLSVKGDISSETRDELKVSFNEHADKVKDLVVKLEAKGNLTAAARINSEFESDLRSHHALIAKLAENDEKDKQYLNEIDGDVTTHLNASIQTRNEEDTKVTALSAVEIQATAEASVKAATNKVTEVQKYIDGNKNITAPAKAQANLQLTIAKDTIVAGNAKLTAKAYTDAYMLFQKAFRTAQHAKMILHSEEDFNININGNFDDGNDANDNNTKSNQKRSDIHTNINTGTQLNNSDSSHLKTEEDTHADTKLHLGL